MKLLTRRLVALAATGALVSAPALMILGGGPAQAAPPPVVSTAAPALDLGGVLGGLLGAVTGSSDGSTGGSTADPITVLLDQLGSALSGTVSSDPTGDLIGLLTSGADPTEVVDQLTDALAGAGVDPGLVEVLASGNPSDIVDALAGVLPIADVFPDGLPPALASVLSGTSTPQPDTVADLIATLVSFYGGQGTQPGDDVASALPAGLLQLLLAGLAAAAPHQPVTTPVSTPVPKPVTKPSTKPVGHSTAPIFQSSSRCRAATAKVRSLHKRLHAAKRRHHAARAKALATRLKKAKRAKRLAC